MQRLETLEFNKNKELFGSDHRINGIKTTQFLMQLDRKISECLAEVYLDGTFEIDHIELLRLKHEAGIISRKSDAWKSFKFSDAGRALAVVYEHALYM